jgi:hypothetical protein
MDNNSKIYLQPEIIRVNLDNEISLALQSEPPLGPGESIGSNLSNDSEQFSQTALRV